MAFINQHHHYHSPMKNLLNAPKHKIWILLLGLLLSAAIARANEEQDLVAILKSNATATEKCDACQKLRLVGTAKAVPAIAPLLTNEPTAHAARYALEGMPYPEAVTALRKAADKSSGSIKVGLIDSVGWRRDTASVSMLKKCLYDNDANIASAAAASLGRIANRKAADALLAARDKTSVQPVLLDALLRCADKLKADGDNKSADKIYTSLTNSTVPENVRAAAARGLTATKLSKH
jgi:HEAT repeat protein